MFAYIAVPFLIVSVLALLILAKYHKALIYRCCTCLSLSLFVMPFSLAFISYALSLFPWPTISYSLGFDIQTPDGVVTVVNDVEIQDRHTPFENLNNFYNGYYAIKATSSVVMLSEEKALVALLSPSDYLTFNYLKLMPERFDSIKDAVTEDGFAKFVLTEKMTPAMVCLGNAHNQNVFSVVTQDSFERSYGAGYSFVRAWVSFEKRHDLGVVHEKVEWWDYGSNKPKRGDIPYKKLELNPAMFGINKKSPVSFLRI